MNATISLPPSPPLAEHNLCCASPAGPTEVLSPEDAKRLVEHWRDLVARTGGSYFQTPDWVLSWWEHRGRPETEIAVWRSGSGAIEAIACLAKVNERLHHRLPISLRVATNLGSGRPHQADHCGWPVLPHRTADVQRWAGNHSWGNSLLLRHLDPETARKIVPNGARLVWTTRCPRLTLSGNGSELIGSAHFRRHLRQLQRKSEAAGLSFRWVGPEQITSVEIDILFDLHEKRRSLETVKRPSSFVRARSMVFHHMLVDWAGPRRGPAIALAERHGVAIAAWYGFLWCDTFSLYQAGWDPAHAKLCPGTLLLTEAIRLAERNGVRVIDFLRGVEPYKYRFGATDAIDETWLVPRHLSGMVLQQKFRLGKIKV